VYKKGVHEVYFVCIEASIYIYGSDICMWKKCMCMEVVYLYGSSVFIWEDICMYIGEQYVSGSGVRTVRAMGAVHVYWIADSSTSVGAVNVHGRDVCVCAEVKKSVCLVHM
jgi:hypothetical protein